MVTKTRAKKPKKTEDATAGPPAPEASRLTIDDLCEFIESRLYARCGDTPAFLRRRAGRVASAWKVVEACRVAYPDLDDEEFGLVLGQFIDDLKDDPALGLQDFLEGFFNEDGSRPRVEPSSIGATATCPPGASMFPAASAASAAPAKRKPSKKVESDDREPLPGQLERPMGGRGPSSRPSHRRRGPTSRSPP